MRARLSDPSEVNRELRRQVYTALRDYDRDGRSPAPWPWIYGDGMAVPATSDLQHLALSPTQDWMLERWAAGKFTPDRLRKVHSSIDEVPVAEQPAQLDDIHVPEAGASGLTPEQELAAVTLAVRRVSEATGHPVDEITGGYVDILDPFNDSK
jgi:hypothetical protein